MATEQKLHKFSLEDTSEITVHTGNIINELKRKTTQSATEELLQCIGSTLSSWKSSVPVTNGVHSFEKLECFNEKNCSVKINKEERKDLKLTVKVFLNSFQVDALLTAIRRTLDELDTTSIETVIVAFPPMDQKISLDQIKPLWTALEKLVAEGVIVTIGISDLDTDMLIELHNWAKLKPSVNQVNLASCCVIPPEMQAFAKENDIQLLTHNDPKEILPKADLGSLLDDYFSYPDDDVWRQHWIVRYSALVKCRGVIQYKGFLVCLQKSVEVEKKA